MLTPHSPRRSSSDIDSAVLSCFSCLGSSDDEDSELFPSVLIVIDKDMVAVGK